MKREYAYEERGREGNRGTIFIVDEYVDGKAASPPLCVLRTEQQAIAVVSALQDAYLKGREDTIEQLERVRKNDSQK